MTLSSGTKLSHYEITSLIGKGGMGEVYQAKDTKLGRSVAIKVLPEEFARDAERVARFQREAKLLASLNHPNIAAIYGLEESDGTNFLVMELVKGQTLDGRIKAGPIPFEEALKLALQIAEALEAAHEKGVIHRDLKPANTKVTPDGKVKVLDFGLAKAFAGEKADLNLSNSPTLSKAATMQGVILGTAAYMSPEQARGKEVDKRTDIGAFGVVLFEMLTGRSLFAGEDVSSTLARVLEREPDFSSLPPNLHHRIRLLLERCLKKDPKIRYHDMGDARVDILEVLDDPAGIFERLEIETGSQTKLRKTLPWISAIILTGIIIGVAVWILKPTELRRLRIYDYHLPKDQELNIGVVSGHALAISPDGSQFVYSTSGGLYLRSENELEAQLIPGTEDNPQSPFFSHDGKSLGYWSQADGKLKKIDIRGGTPVALCDATMVYGAEWYEDNTIIYGEAFSGIKRVSANGGTPKSLNDGLFVEPQLLPDRKSMIFTDFTTPPYTIVVQTLESGERTELFPGWGARYLPTGHLVYSDPENATLFAVDFDPDTLEVTGSHVPIREGVTFYAISDSGNLVYIPQRTFLSASSFTPQRILVWVDREGNEEQLEADPDLFENCKISPDGTKVALAIESGGNVDIWIKDLIRGTMPKLTINKAIDIAPLWTLDGQRIIFYSRREEGLGGIYCKSVDSVGAVEKLGSLQDRIISPQSWSEDGNALVIQELAISPLIADIGILSMDRNHKIKPLLQENYIEYGPIVSPKGKWMAYQSDESGQFEIYMCPFPEVDSGVKEMISSGGGHSPLWSPDGKEIFYRNGDATMVVAIETDPTFQIGKPESLFRGMYYSDVPRIINIPSTPWDINPVDKRFLMIKQSATITTESTDNSLAAPPPRKINIVLNWFEELKEKVPVD